MENDKITKIQEILEKVKLQLKASDKYAIQNKSKTDLLPSVWEIQNRHIRDSVSEIETIIEREAS